MRSIGKRGAVAAALIAALAIAILGWLWRGHGTSSATTAEPASTAIAAPQLPDPARAERFRDIQARRARLSPELPVLALEGVVLDPAGQPAAGAEVRLAAPGRTMRTSEDGTFAFAELPPGHYSIEARRAAEVAAATRVELRPGSGPITLQLRGGMVAVIEVVSAHDEAPIPGAEVSLHAGTMQPGTGEHHGITDDRGRVELTGVELTNHDLRVSARGYADAWRGPSFKERDGDRWHTRVELEPGEEVQGTVTREDGSPVAGALVEAEPNRGGQRAVDEDEVRRSIGLADPHVVDSRGHGARTGEDGSFRLGLPAGDWVLVASHRGLEPTASEPVFTGGGGPHRVSIVMGEGASVAGVVVDGDDRPVPGAELEVRWREASSFVIQRGQADGTGGFRIAGLPRAPLSVVARSEDARSQPVDVDLTELDPSQQSLLIELALGGAITGTVVDHEARPIAGATVVYGEVPVRGRDSTLYPAVESTAEDGRFRIAGLDPDREYTITASRPQDGDLVRRTRTVGARAGDDVTIEVPADGIIVGRVVGGDRAAVQGVTVTAPVGGAFTRVEPSGRFQLSVPPRAYELRVSGPRIADTFLERIEVSPGETTDLGDVRVQSGRPVSGVVLSPEGEPAVVASVAIEVDGAYALQVQTGDDGRFSTIAPDASRLRITASHERHGDAAPVVLGSGAEASGLEIQLRSGPTVRGRATASGMALADRPVLAWDASGPRQKRPVRGTVTDRDGSYALHNLPPGVYDLEMMLPERPTQDLNIYVYRERVEVRDQDLVVDFDASAGQAGAEVMPTSDAPELPTHTPSQGAEGDHDH